jgi:diguanylate cyclase (GGDEF)-like protein/hemerythrin-like metal-binding protein/PAS domain S-box-containing protein
MASEPKSARFFWLSLGLFVLFSAAFVYYLHTQRQIDRTNDARLTSFVLGDELRQSSDDLTRMIRTYVATGKPVYKRHYQEILDIRNGLEPRPRDYHNVYWDLVLEDDVRPRPSGRTVSLLQLMRQSGFTPREFAKLEEAKASSDALTRTEYAAMALVESTSPVSEANRLRATGMLNDAAYHEAKARIMRPIGEFNEIVSARTLQAVRKAQRHAARTRTVLVALGILLAFSLWHLLRSITRATRASAETATVFRAVFDNAAVGLAQIAPDGRVLNVNQEFCRIIGRGSEEILAPRFTFDAVTRPEDLRAEHAHVERLLRGEADSFTLVKRFMRPDDSVTWVELCVDLLRDESGKPVSLISAAVDITASKLAEAELARHRSQLEQLVSERTTELQSRNEQLREEMAAHRHAAAALQASEGRYRFIAENTFDVIWTMNLSSQRLSYVSPSVERLLGYTPEEIMAQPFGSTMTAESATRFRGALADAVANWKGGERSRTMLATEIGQPHKDGHIVQTEMVTTLHENEAGKLESILGVTRDITERKQAEEAIRHLAFYDGLTQLPNRRLLLDRLQQTIARCRRSLSPAALLFIDLDKFKPINDELGHDVGDWLLQSVARRMSECLRPYDTAARVGGDEFVILLPDLAKAEQALVIAERVRATLETPFVTNDGQRLEVSASVGVALYPDHGENERELLRAGDEAMYRAKKSGRNRVQMLAVSELVRIPSEPVSDPKGFARVVWKSEYTCGHSVIDTEHHALFRNANRLIEYAARRDWVAPTFRAMLDELLSEIGTHFRHEEDILREHGYAQLPQHSRLHQALLKRGEAVRLQANGAGVSVAALIEFVAVEVIANHVLLADRDFFPLLVVGPMTDPSHGTRDGGPGTINPA